MKFHLVTGGAGFIATNLIARLLARDDAVLALDDLSRGEARHWRPFENHPGFRSAVVDCSDLAAYRDAAAAAAGSRDLTDVWHLAANSDIPAGIADPSIDFKDTFTTTFNTLVVMNEFAIGNLHFASSSAVYGDLGETLIHEDVGPLEPISNYGAMKLASEAQIRAAVETGSIRANIFRFPNVVGIPATHGVILDLVRKLKSSPDSLEVLGDGTQRKAYLHVEELVEAMLFIGERAAGRYNVFNIGPTDEGVLVSAIAEALRARVAPGAEIRFGEGPRGWIGDVPRFRYSIDRLAALGWRPRSTSRQAIERAIGEIVVQESARA